jgi:tetratricopeptide (TPR) repeat protein
MPPQRFFLSLGLSGSIAFGLCMLVTFVFYVPALALYGVLMFAILVKTSFNRRLKISGHPLLRISYFLLLACAGWSFYVFSAPKLMSHGLELRARQQLDHLVDMRIHLSGNADLLDDVVLLFEDSLVDDDQNVNAWIGLSSAICQEFFRDPALFDSIGERAVYCANHAVELGPEYWMAWAQLGVANSFYGDAQAAETAFTKALELAPNSSNAHYYFASFLGADGNRISEALSSVRKALEINPNNSAARRLEQKLLIL